MDHIDQTIAALKDKFGEAIEEVTVFRGETSVTVAKDRIVDVLAFLKQTSGLGFDFLATITAYDNWPDEPRFVVIYQLREMSRPTNLRLRCRVPGDDARLPSATGVFRNANWYERELLDMFGLTFTGHPDPRRILMPADWGGHPLRRDYPLGYEEVQFTFNFDEIDRKKPYARE